MPLERVLKLSRFSLDQLVRKSRRLLVVEKAHRRNRPGPVAMERKTEVCHGARRTGGEARNQGCHHQQSRSLLDAVHREPAVQEGAAHARAAPRACTTATADGRKVLDGTAGLWCVQRRPRPAADRRGGRRAGQRSSTMRRPSRWAIPRCSSWPTRLVTYLPPRASTTCFFTNSGSESVETGAEDRARLSARHAARARRFRLIGRERGYHGVNFGGISVGGIVNNRKILRHAAHRRRPYPPHPRPGPERLLARPAGAWRRVRRRARAARARCTMPRPSPRSSSSRWPARPAC